jgi:hypothetical protein
MIGKWSGERWLMSSSSYHAPLRSPLRPRSQFRRLRSQTPHRRSQQHRCRFISVISVSSWFRSNPKRLKQETTKVTEKGRRHRILFKTHHGALRPATYPTEHRKLKIEH